jgi:ABC-type cobalamin/Fe3+-siderophores transport system ATPase subunit
MEIAFQVINIQHIVAMSFYIDLDKNCLTCIVGKNGSGKTTLIKSINNFCSADTFKKTSPDGIFNEGSSIIYKVNEREYRFLYDTAIRSINCKEIIPDDIKKKVDVELPMPFGQRFSFFQSLSNADLDIRTAIVLENYSAPSELIDFLNDIYTSRKFDRLIQVSVKALNYYCILLEDSRYIREDHLSSGEYFLINLYRKIKSQCKLIVIDEIDISLDAAAQVNLVRKLRDFCGRYQVNILFTTHSLPMMKTLEEGELLYMEESNGIVDIFPISYNYIKSILFGFKGWDKYILTEDIMLQNFMEYVIKNYCADIFYRYKIIYIGGAPNVADLMRRNTLEGFFSTPANVISVLDGDQRAYRYARDKENIYFLPWESVEKQLYQDYLALAFQPALTKGVVIKDHEALHRESKKVMPEDQIFKYLCETHSVAILEFSEIFRVFLAQV